MVGDVTNGYLSMKECSRVAWTSWLKDGNVTKTVSELSKSSEEWHAPTSVRSGMLHDASIGGVFLGGMYLVTTYFQTSQVSSIIYTFILML
jgi:hypothetical protein